VADTQDQVGARAGAARRAAEADAAEHRLDLHVQRPQRRSQQHVVLKAVAAAPLVHELALQVVELERDRDAAVGVEVLERDRGDVGAMDLGQAGAGADPDPFQVGSQIHGPGDSRAVGDPAGADYPAGMVSIVALAAGTVTG
jgi:hypothetical protein